MSFASRGKPRKLAADSENLENESNEDKPLFRRPSVKSKKRSATARVSFGVRASKSDDEDEEGSTVVVPKRGGLGRKILEKNASRRSDPSGAHLQGRSDRGAEDDGERPTYSKAYLDELRQSTPSTAPPADKDADGDIDMDFRPKEINVASKFGPQPGTSTAVNVASKFPGADLSIYESSSVSRIPSAVEIQEKKARRARLAREQKAAAGGSSDSDSGADRDEDDDRRSGSDSDEFRAQHDTISFQPSGTAASGFGAGRTRERASRMVREDEDFMEADEAYPSRGTIAMSRGAEREQRAAERREIQSLIASAEGSGEDDAGDDSSDSEREAREAYESVQTRRALDRRAESKDDGGVEMPKRLPPLPNLSTIIEKVREKLELLKQQHAQDVERLEDVAREREGIREAEKGVDEVLADINQRWRQLVEAGIIEEKEGTKLLEQSEATAAIDTHGKAKAEDQ